MFNQFKQSLSKSDIYEKPENNRFPKALGYVAVLLVIVTAIKIVIFGTIFSPAIGLLKTAALEAIEKYPTDLIVTLSHGELSTNRKSPVIATASDANFPSTPSVQNLLVIDTSRNIDIQNFSSYKTILLANKDGYVVMDKNGGYKVQTYKNFPDHVLTKAEVESLKPKIEKIFGPLSIIWIFLLLVLMFIAIYAASFIGAMIFSLIGVIVALIVTRIRKHKLSFSQLYALSLYAYTAVIIVGIFETFTGLTSWVGVIIFVALIIFLTKNKDQTI